MRLGVGPGTHDFFYLVLGHLVLPKSNVVHKETSAELIGNSSSESTSPCDTEHHIERDAKCAHSTKLVMSTQVIDGHATDGKTVEGEAEGNVSRILLLLL